MELGKFLLMSDERQKNVFQINIDTGEVRALTINQGFYLTAMTFDPLCNCFYHFDRVNQIVKKTAFDNSYIQNLFYANGRLYEGGLGPIHALFIFQIQYDFIHHQHRC